MHRICNRNKSCQATKLLMHYFNQKKKSYWIYCAIYWRYRPILLLLLFIHISTIWGVLPMGLWIKFSNQLRWDKIRSKKRCPGYDTQLHLMLRLQFWRVWCTPSLAFLADRPWLGVVVSVRVPSKGMIDLIENYSKFDRVVSKKKKQKNIKKQNKKKEQKKKTAKKALSKQVRKKENMNVHWSRFRNF